MDGALHDLRSGRDDDVVLVEPGRTVTRGELRAAAGSVARVLRDRAVAPGDRVAVTTSPDARSVAALLGARAAGAIVCPVALDELAGASADLRPKAVLTADDVERILAQRAPLEPVDRHVAWGIRTSGSTGRAKVVLLSVDSAERITESTCRLLGLTEADRIFSVLPLHHILGLCQIWVALRVRAPLVLPGRPLLPADFVTWAKDATFLPAIPAHLRWLMKASAPPELRVVSLGGQVTLPDERLAFAKAFPRTAFFNIYGLTEAFRALWLHPDEFASRPEAAGRPFPGMKAWLADDGELMLRGPHVALGYLDDPEGTRRRFPSPGTVRTGDLFRRDGDLYSYVGRADAVFKVYGEKVVPELVERVLDSHPGVARSLVTGRRGADNELHPVARIVAAGPAPDLEALKRFVEERVPRVMVPARFELVDSLPMTPSGKLKRGRAC